MRKRIALFVAAALIATLMLSTGMASALGPKTIYFDYYENYYPYPSVSDYTLTPSTTISEGQVFSYSQITSAGFYINGVRTGSPTSIAYSDPNNRLSILVTRRERPVAPAPVSYPETTPGVYGYGYYYGANTRPASNLLTIGPATYQAVKGKSYKFINCRFGGTAISPSKLRWESSDTSIATVSKDGTVRARKTGTVTITAKTTDGGISASVTFVIN